MNKVGLKVLLVDKTDLAIGGDCLNDGCVPSKALLHMARIAYSAGQAKNFGLAVDHKIDLKEAIKYIQEKQGIIREHENASYLRQEGLEVVLGTAKFSGEREIEVKGHVYSGSKIVLATGSKPRKLKVPGIEQVVYFDNESIFHVEQLPKRLLVIGGGPIGVEIGQAFSRLGSQVTMVHRGGMILPHDDYAVTKVLYKRLKEEGITFIFDAEVESFPSGTEAKIKTKAGEILTLNLDAIFVGVGRETRIDGLQLERAGIERKEGKIVVNDYLQTSNRNIYVCGDVAGSLQFSHAAEQQARLLLNNFFSPIKKKLNNDLMSWVTFTDPEVATFGLSEKQLKEKGIKYRRLETDFSNDDRAITDNYQFGKSVLFISQGSFMHNEKLLGGTMVAPGAGELVQELILAMMARIPINQIFEKIYPYPVASRVNQRAILEYKQESLTERLKKLLRLAFRIFS